jgi:acyl carrier protein
MSHEQIVESITPVFRDVFDDQTLLLSDELTAHDVKNWDSLNHITLIVELETLTGLSFSTDELVDLQNVGDFVRLLAAKGYRG